MDMTQLAVEAPAGDGFGTGGPFPMLGKHGCCFDDEFMIYDFKIAKCLIVQPHIWRDCPFVHPGEPVQRRHPSLYQGDLCPAVKQGKICPHGPEKCSYAHNAFEAWLHPQKYKTIMCRKGANCNRDICFFAHSAKELRAPSKSRPMPLPDPSEEALTTYSQWVTGGTSQMPEVPPLSLQVPPSGALAVPASMSQGVPASLSLAAPSGTAGVANLGPLVSMSSPSLAPAMPGQQVLGVLPAVQGPLVPLPPAVPGQQFLVPGQQGLLPGQQGWLPGQQTQVPGQLATHPLLPPGLAHSRFASSQLPSSNGSSSSISGNGAATAAHPGQLMQGRTTAPCMVNGFPTATATTAAIGTGGSVTAAPSSLLQLQLRAALQGVPLPAALDNSAAAAAAAAAGGSNAAAPAGHVLVLPVANQAEMLNLADLAGTVQYQPATVQQQLVLQQQLILQQQQQQRRRRLTPAVSPTCAAAAACVPTGTANANSSGSSSGRTSAEYNNNDQASVTDLSNIGHLLRGLSIESASAAATAGVIPQHQHHIHDDSAVNLCMATYKMDLPSSAPWQGQVSMWPAAAPAAACQADPRVLQQLMQQASAAPAIDNRMARYVPGEMGFSSNPAYGNEWLMSGLGI